MASQLNKNFTFLKRALVVRNLCSPLYIYFWVYLYAKMHAIIWDMSSRYVHIGYVLSNRGICTMNECICMFASMVGVHKSYGKPSWWTENKFGYNECAKYTLYFATALSRAVAVRMLSFLPFSTILAHRFANSPLDVSSSSSPWCSLCCSLCL